MMCPLSCGIGCDAQSFYGYGRGLMDNLYGQSAGGNGLPTYLSNVPQNNGNCLNYSSPSSTTFSPYGQYSNQQYSLSTYYANSNPFTSNMYSEGASRPDFYGAYNNKYGPGNYGPPFYCRDSHIFGRWLKSTNIS